MVCGLKTIGTNGFTMFFVWKPLVPMVLQWFLVQQPLDTMVFQWFPMVAKHWSNDGVVTIHHYGLFLVMFDCPSTNKICSIFIPRPLGRLGACKHSASDEKNTIFFKIYFKIWGSFNNNLWPKSLLSISCLSISLKELEHLYHKTPRKNTFIQA